MINSYIYLFKIQSLFVIFPFLILTSCIGGKNSEDYGFKKSQETPIVDIEAIVISTHNRIIRGGQYDSEIFIGTPKTLDSTTIYLTYEHPFYDSIISKGTVNYMLRSNCEYEVMTVDNNYRGHHSKFCTTLGNFSYGGLIQIKKNGEEFFVPFNSDYSVVTGDFVMSSCINDVLYKGVENFVNLAIFGFPEELISVSIGNGGALKEAKGGGYIVTVPKSVKSDIIPITVSIRTKEGGRVLGKKEFKVINVPHPKILVANEYSDGSEISKDTIKHYPCLKASSDISFDYNDDISFEVVKFDIFLSSNGIIKSYTIDGSCFSNEILNIIDNMSTGSLITFTNIYYEGPSGEFKTNGLSLVLK